MEEKRRTYKWQNNFLGRIKVEQEKLSPRDSINSSVEEKEEDIVKS